MIEEKKEYKKYTLGWLRERAKKAGFENIRDWQKWIIGHEKDIWAQNDDQQYFKLWRIDDKYKLYDGDSS